jgi:putative hydrolase of the HAD superfamily
MPANSERVLLFDLGGVLVDIAPADRMLASLGLPSERELAARFPGAAPWISLEIGQIDGPAFAIEFAKAFEVTLDPARVLSEFEAWNLGFYPGAVETLTALRDRHRTAVLSNTNEVHWTRLAGEMAIPTLVEVAFASHLIGLRKPDAACYHYVATQLGVTPADLVFFDDNEANIEGALSLGIDAHRVEGIAALRERLADLGYL